jgi:hypothetical protein
VKKDIFQQTYDTKEMKWKPLYGANTTAPIAIKQRRY